MTWKSPSTSFREETFKRERETKSSEKFIIVSTIEKTEATKKSFSHKAKTEKKGKFPSNLSKLLVID